MTAEGDADITLETSMGAVGQDVVSKLTTMRAALVETIKVVIVADGGP